MKRAIQIVDLGFGDSGKGTTVDYLARQQQADLVVRFNGGPQAGHNVVLPDGRHHTFAQFGSGAFVPGVRTLLSRFMLIEPYAMLNEARHLDSLGVTDALSRTIIDRRCLVITPPQQIANRLRERARGAGAHGTCGLGVGECVADDLADPGLSIRASDMLDSPTLRRKLLAMLEHKRAQLAPLREFASADQLRVLDDAAWIEIAIDNAKLVARQTQIVDDSPRRLADADVIIFEAAQGVLLDERFGFHPHTTWSRTTFANADVLLDEIDAPHVRRRVGVIRTYLTRHGAGPFVTQSSRLDHLAEPHNLDHGFQGRFRRGSLDLVMLRYALDACGGIDALAVTHLDRLGALPAVACDAYLLNGHTVERMGLPPGASLDEMQVLGEHLLSAEARWCEWPREPGAWLAALEAALGVRVTICSNGPTYRDKHVRGNTSFWSG